MSRFVALAALLTLALLLAACNGGSGSDATPTAVDTGTPAPAATEGPTPAPTPTPGLVVPDTSPAPGIDLPSGFTAYTIAKGFFRPTSIALSPDGAIYISLRHDGVLRLEDGDGDGVFDDHVLFTPAFDETTGIVFSPEGVLYVSSRGQVTTARDTDGDAVADETDEIITDLPRGLHQNDDLVFGPDGKLYFANGSTCDECVDADERSATILQANPDGSDLRVYASGLRNSYDLVFDAQGRLWATDNGSDGATAPFCATIDELNLIEDGGDYGWPYAPACDPYQSGIPPAASLGLHTGSTGIDAYDAGRFPAEYRGNLFLTLWGSYAFDEELPHALYRVVIEEGPGGPQADLQLFGGGFEQPIDVVVDTDGSLLVLTYESGKLYRIVYTGG